jgi:hypothetical protein
MDSPRTWELHNASIEEAEEVQAEDLAVGLEAEESAENLGGK